MEQFRKASNWRILRKLFEDLRKLLKNFWIMEQFRKASNWRILRKLFEDLRKLLKNFWIIFFEDWSNWKSFWKKIFLEKTFWGLEQLWKIFNWRLEQFEKKSSRGLEQFVKKTFNWRLEQLEKPFEEFEKLFEDWSN